MKQDRWAVWEGVEIEGRLSGMRTLFIRDLPDDLQELPDSYEHVWLCKEYVERYRWTLAQHLSDLGIVVSIELTPDLLEQIPASVAARCHLVLALPAPVLLHGKLKATDTVRLDAEPYNVYTATFHQFQHTPAQAYHADTLIAERV